MTDEKNMLDLEALQQQIQALNDSDLDLVDGGKLSGGAIAGIATAAAIAAAAIIGIPTALHFKNKPKAGNSAPAEVAAPAEAPAPAPTVQTPAPVPTVETATPAPTVEASTANPVNYPQPTGDFYFDVPSSTDPSGYKRLFDKLT